MKAFDKLAKKVTTKADQFADGDVIRWVAEGNTKDYIYAAVRAGGRWWITGTSQWYVHSGVTYDQLVEYLERDEVVAIQAATEWTESVKEPSGERRLARATAEAMPTCGGCGLKSPCFC
jgi:hypothetical protein